MWLIHQRDSSSDDEDKGDPLEEIAHSEDGRSMCTMLRHRQALHQWEPSQGTAKSANPNYTSAWHHAVLANKNVYIYNIPIWINTEINNPGKQTNTSQLKPCSWTLHAW